MKKWTYLVAAVLMSGTAPFFTSCIDNDEPEGISILRGAKAELIRAKVAVQEAIAADNLAAAKLKEAQAKVEEANAKIKEAEAKLQEAQAEAEKAKLEAIIKKAEADAQKALNEAEAVAQAAEDAHRLAMEQLKQLQAQLMQQQAEALEFYYTRYDNAQKDFYTKKSTYLDAEREHNLAQKDPETLTSFKDIKKQKAIVEEAKAVRDEKQAEVDGLNEELKNFNIQPGELGKKFDELKKKQDTYQASLDALNLKLEQLKYDNAAEYEKAIALENAIAEVKAEEITVEKYSVELPAYLPNVNPGEFQIISNELKYTLDNLQEYETALRIFENKLGQLKEMQYNDNDAAWLEQQIKYEEANVADYTKSYTDVHKIWENVVKAYKSGTSEVNYAAYGKVYDDLKAAVEAYNALVPNYDAAQKAYEEADKAFEAAAKDELEAKTAKQIYEAAKVEALKPVTALDKQIADAIKKDKEAWNAADKDLRIKALEADAAYKKAQKEFDNGDLTLNELKKFEAALNAANKAVQDHKPFDEAAAVEKYKKQLKYDDVYLAYEKALIDAELAFEKAILEWGSETAKDPAIVSAVKEAQAKVAEAGKKLQAAKQNLDKAMLVVDDANRAFRDYIYDSRGFMWFINRYKALDLAGTLKRYVTPEIAKSAVNTYSDMLFGTKIGNPLLIDLGADLEAEKKAVRALVKAQMEAERGEEVANWEVEEEITLGGYGWIGNIISSTYEIDKMKSYMSNQEEAKKVYAEVEAKRTEIVAAKEAQQKKVEEAVEARDVQNEVILALEKPVHDEKDALIKENAAIAPLLEAMGEVIKDKEDPNNYTQEDVDGFKEEIEEAIETAEEEIPALETALKEAEDLLAQMEDQKLTNVAFKEYQKNKAKIAMDQAQTVMETAEDLLKAMIARLEKSVE